MPSCHSTNDIGLQLANKPDTSEGTVIITDDQTNGRGQRGNVWNASSGKNLTLSIILKPNFLSPANQYFLNMAISIGVHATVSHYCSEKLSYIKWPNDILIEKKKVAGILIENGLSGNRLEYSVIGIGLNINQQRFEIPKATSIHQETGGSNELEEVYETLLNNIEANYLRLKAGRRSEIKQDYLRSLLGYKSPLKFRAEVEFEGTIEDVADSGLLRLSMDGQVMSFDFKEIEFLL